MPPRQTCTTRSRRSAISGSSSSRSTASSSPERPSARATPDPASPTAASPTGPTGRRERVSGPSVGPALASLRVPGDAGELAAAGPQQVLRGAELGRLGLAPELLPAGEPLGRQGAVRERRLHGASRLAGVAAVVEPAGLRQLVDVRERGGHPLLVGPQADGAPPLRVDEDAATGQRVGLAGGRGVAALGV